MSIEYMSEKELWDAEHAPKNFKGVLSEEQYKTNQRIENDAKYYNTTNQTCNNTNQTKPVYVMTGDSLRRSNISKEFWRNKKQNKSLY